jgi:hypothetical protein
MTLMVTTTTTTKKKKSASAFLGRFFAFLSLLGKAAL